MSVESPFRRACESCGFMRLLTAYIEENGPNWWHVFLELPNIPYGDAAFYIAQCTPEEAEDRYGIGFFAHLLASNTDAGNIDAVEVFNVSSQPGQCTLLIVVTFYTPVSAGPVAGHPSMFCAATLEALGIHLEKMSFASLYTWLTPHVSEIPGYCFGLDVDDAMEILREKEVE